MVTRKTRANLRPPWRKGQSGNPTGINQWTKSRERYRAVMRALDALEELEEGDLRDHALRRLAQLILRGGLDDAARDARVLARLLGWLDPIQS
jgi:uncharacterized protein HemY